MFGGISLFLDKTYEIGDFIIIDDKDRGEVVDIGLRSTKIKTRDEELVSVPNSIMANSKVINESGFVPRLRVRLDLNVAYDSNLDKVEKTLLDLAKRLDYIETKPEPRVRFREFADYSINLQFLFWVKKAVYKGRYKHFVIKEVHKEFIKKGIAFPYPTQEIYLKKK